jgi:hypothetical protein
MPPHIEKSPLCGGTSSCAELSARTRATFSLPERKAALTS